MGFVHCKKMEELKNEKNVEDTKGKMKKQMGDL